MWPFGRTARCDSHVTRQIQWVPRDGSKPNSDWLPRTRQCEQKMKHAGKHAAWFGSNIRQTWTDAEADDA